MQVGLGLGGLAVAGREQRAAGEHGIGLGDLAT